MANEGFEYPCELIVKKNMGILRLRAVEVTHLSAADGKKYSAKISSLKYFDGTRFCDAERAGDFFQFPVEILHFVNIGNDVGRVLHGSVCLKMTSSAQVRHMPESTAVFYYIALIFLLCCSSKYRFNF